MNYKNIGEIGERIAIGELAKYGIDVLIPLSDNLHYDFVIYKDNKFYKCQVKTSLQSSPESEGSYRFSLVSSNWYSKTTYKYSKEDVDIFILCDGNNIYLYKYTDLKDKSSIYIRLKESENKQTKGVNFAKDSIISNERLKYLFN